MKRKTKNSMTGGWAAALAVLVSGCAVLDGTVALDPAQIEEFDPHAFPGDPDFAERPDEPQNWSRLSKEGRQHLIFGRYSMAEQSLLEAFSISKSFRASDVRRRVAFGNLEHLAAAYRIAHYDSSARRVLSIIAIESREQTEFDYPGLADLLLELGKLEEDSDQLERAEQAYRRALDLRIAKSGPNSATLIEIYQKLSSVEIRRNQAELAVTQARRALELAEIHIGQNAPAMIEARLQAARAHQYAGAFETAEAQYLQALEAQREIEAASLTEAIALKGLADGYRQTDRLEEALTHVDQALEILELSKIESGDHAMALDTKAQILAAQGENVSAESLFEEMLLYLDTASTADQRLLYQSYESFLMNQNRVGEAARVREKIERLGGGPTAQTTAPKALPGLTEKAVSRLPAEHSPVADVASPDPGSPWDD